MSPRKHHLIGSFAVLGVAALVAAGCGSDSSDSKSSSNARSDSSMMTMTDEEHLDATGSDQGGATVSAAADTRVTLDRLLGEHTILASLATTRALAGGKDVDAAVAALGQNTTDLAGVIGSVYGDDAARRFTTMWEGHIADLVAYTSATAKKDAAGQKAAKAKLDAYVDEFGAFLATATDLPAAAVKGALSAHVAHHTGIIDAYAKGDYAGAAKLQQAAYAHMIMVGDTLAAGIAAQQGLDDGDATKAGVDTRVKVGSLLAAHTALAYLATTDALSGSKSFAQDAAALNANSAELGTVIGGVYGAKVKEAFDDQWASHIGYLVDYTKAVAGKDDAAKQKAVQQLDGYVSSFGSFLATATDLPVDAVRDGLKAHVQHHAGSVDAFAAGNYEQAYEVDRAAYEHMWKLGDTLSAAIVAQQAAKS